jgi:hypothetical protein
MTDEEDPIELRLVKDATLLDIEVVESKIEPTPGDDDYHVRMTLNVDEDLVETCAFGLIFTLGLLSFHDGRPRGYSGKFFEDDDEWTVGDMLRHLEFKNGHLYFYADSVRGRCMKTNVEVTSEGKVVLETFNRGQAATRWVDRVRGKKFVEAVPDA